MCVCMYLLLHVQRSAAVCLALDPSLAATASLLARAHVKVSPPHRQRTPAAKKLTRTKRNEKQGWLNPGWIFVSASISSFAQSAVLKWHGAEKKTVIHALHDSPSSAVMITITRIPFLITPYVVTPHAYTAPRAYRIPHLRPNCHIVCPRALFCFPHFFLELREAYVSVASS